MLRRSSCHVIKKALIKGAGVGLVTGGLGGGVGTLFVVRNNLIMGDEDAFKKDVIKAEAAAILAGALVGVGTGLVASKSLKMAGSLAKKTFSNSTHTLFASMTAVPTSFVGGVAANLMTLKALEERSHEKMRVGKR